MKLKTKQNKISHLNQEKILLANLPYWDPLIPPMGIACLKSFLQNYGCEVKTLDLNVEEEFKEIYNQYFDTLKKFIPGNRQGNFYNIGHDVLQNHMMAYINHEDKNEYIDLVKTIIDKIFFCDINYPQVFLQDKIIGEFYTRLEKYFNDLLDREMPGLLGFTVYKATLPAAMFVFKLAKKKFPRMMTVMGGGIFADTMAVGSPNLEFFLEKTKDYIDKIIIGKGERLLLKILRKELPQSQRLFTLKDIGDSPPVNIPDLSDFDLRHYPYLAASGSSGCSFRCQFCNSSIYYGEYHEKDVKQTVDEMIALYKKYGSRIYFMTDALLNPVITEIAGEFLKRKHSLYFDGYFRIDNASADVEKTLLWRRGGFYRARLGVESGSQKVLDSMGKRITLRQIKDALFGLAYAGIKTTAYFVIGYPCESEKDFCLTLELLEDIRNHVWQAECVPFAYYYNGQPGTDQWAHKRMLLYPESARDMLITQTWILDGEPSREEVYSRVFRFVEHCRKLGIPNPYSFNEIYKADERWKKLHKNAVPALMSLISSEGSAHETIEVKKYRYSQSKNQFGGDFSF
jgi:radical SAM superfamily enzyme YgiQ (UPF0313 family)